MSNEPDVLTEDEALLRTIQRHYAIAAAWPCRDNRLPEATRPAVPARAPPETRVEHEPFAEFGSRVSMHISTDRIIAGLAAAYFAYRLWSGWGDGTIYGDGNMDVHADKHPTTFVLTVAFICLSPLATCLGLPKEHSNGEISDQSERYSAGRAR
jgi:hypothetical protein